MAGLVASQQQGDGTTALCHQVIFIKVFHLTRENRRLHGFDDYACHAINCQQKSTLFTKIIPELTKKTTLCVLKSEIHYSENTSVK